jgi:hypothetical protein
MSDPPQNVSALSFWTNVTNTELFLMRVPGDELPLTASPANETHTVATAEIIREEDSNPCSGDEISMDEYIKLTKSVSRKRDEDFVGSADIATDAAVCHSKKPRTTNTYVPISCTEEEAKRNYERFHSLPKGSTTTGMLMGSSAGIAGWASCKIEESLQDEEAKILVIIAKQNYETFHSLSPGSATLEMLENSLAGIAGWAKNDKPPIKKPTATTIDVPKSCEMEEAKRNGEAFHSLPKGSDTTGMLIGSSAVIAGWASCKIEEPLQDEEAKILVKIAKQNYETFHSLSPGSATLEMLENSLAGIAGWAKIDKPPIEANSKQDDMSTKRNQSSNACASNESTQAPSHRRSPSLAKALQSPTLTRAPSRDLAALEPKQQEQHYMLLSYEKDVYKEKNRQMSSFKDIKSEEIAGPAGLLQTPSNQKGDKNMDSLEAVNYDAKHTLSDANVHITSSPSRRRGNEEEALQLRLALLESLGVQVPYGAKLLSMSHGGIDDNANTFCDCDSEAEDEAECSDEDDPEKQEQDDSTKVAKPLPESLTTVSSDAEIAKTDQKSTSPSAENSIASSEDEGDKPSETGLSTRIESIDLASSEDDMDIASQGSEESFVVVPTRVECDSSASTSSEWSVV